ncbi:MAG: energy transducer TonB [Chitinophaga sp.]|uniref:energy transducer TonB n=1 Tax=Chitinophaga sp. TaxID=1869181 RepID=UPI0025BD6597|nr:energy transducer TonB [Chitinophaga sp.]MBV8254063.1 energy transducer TonB [Chitinophaga sp.]
MENYFLRHLVEKPFAMNTTKIRGDEFLDILFTGRNKDYGAYELRSRYDKRVRNAILCTASIALLLVGGYVVNNSWAADKGDTKPFVYKPIAPIDPIIEQPRNTPPPPPPVAQTPPPAAPTSKFVAPKIAPDDQAPDEIPPQEELRHNNIGVKNEVGVEGGADIPPELAGNGGSGVVKLEVPPARDEPFITVEIMPEFPGGLDALGRYLQRNMRYPDAARENGIYGTVPVQFVVSPDGSIGDVKVLGARKGGGLEEEAMRVIKGMPKWKPGRQGGRNVPVYFTIPVKFQLDN